MSRPRKGGTLIELLVALVLLDLALLSLATASATAARRIGEANRRSRATLAATNRLESLAARSCAAIAGGSAQVERGVTETWTASRAGSFMELGDSIEIASRPAEYLVLRTRVPCR